MLALLFLLRGPALTVPYMNETKRYLRTNDSARYVGLVSGQTLRRYRMTGGGPPFIVLSANRVVYDVSDLDSWMLARKRGSTAETRAAALEAPATPQEAHP